MDKIMDVYISKADYATSSEAHANLSLPAMPFELFDAMDQARIQQGDELYFEVSEYYAFENMEPFISYAVNLLELNALCQKLSELDQRQSAAFEGLLKMEIATKNGPIAIGKLIDLAYSADCCHVVGEVLNDSQLGRFYAENGFLPELENLPDKVFDLLDFERIGRELRQSEGGVFTDSGYVVQHSELAAVYKNMTFTTQTPVYQILLENMQGNRFELPMQNPPIEGVYACLDCRVPMLMAAIDVADIQEVNDFAGTLKNMGDKPMRKYKAVLSASGCDSLEDAAVLAEHLDEYKPLALIREIGFLTLNARDDFEMYKKFIEQGEFGDDDLQKEMELTEIMLPPPSAEEAKRILLKNAKDKDIKRAAAYYKVLRYSFNANGETYGGKKCDVRRFFVDIWNFSKKFADITIENKDFEALIKQYDRENAFIYCDPPYYDAEAFYKHVDPFGKEDHIRLHDCLSKAEGFVMVSYNNAPEIVELYKDFYIFYTTRANSMSRTEGAIYEELIMTNYDPRPFLQQKNHQMNLFSFLSFWVEGDYKLIHSPARALKIYK